MQSHEVTATPQLFEKQAEAWDAFWDKPLYPYILYGGAAGGGKSVMICTIALAIVTMHKGTRVLIGRTERTKLYRTTVETFWKVAAKAGIPRSLFYENNQYGYMIYKPTGSRVDWMELRYKPQDPEWSRLGSLELTAAFLEEAQEIPFKAFDVLKSRIGRCNNRETGVPGKIMITANPEKNWLYKIFYIPHRDGCQTAPHYFIPSLFGDNPFLPKEYGDQLESISDDVLRQRLKYGVWDYANAPTQLISPESLMLSESVPFVAGQARIGVDVATEYGSDDAVIVRVVGNSVVDIQLVKYRGSTKKADEQLAAAIIEAASNELFPCPARQITVDVSGVGAAVWAVLRSKGWVTGRFYGNETVDPSPGKAERFKNRRTATYWRLREMLRAGEFSIPASLPYRDRASTELQAFHYEQDQSTITLENKKLTRNRLGHSPDIADAIMLASCGMHRQPKQQEKPNIIKEVTRPKVLV